MKETELSTLNESEDTVIAPALRAQTARKTTLVSVVVNIVLSTLQITVGYFARSQALIADGIHSLSDLFADFVVLVANHHSQKDPDEDHPYGHQRFENAASLILGLILMLVAVGILWAAIQKLLSPDQISEVSILALFVAVFTLVSKEGLFRYMLKAAKSVKSSMLVANAWHARSDAASSLVVAVGIVGNLMGYPILDPIAALIVALMIARMGWNFGTEALHDLMDRTINEDEIREIKQTLIRTPGVLGAHDIRARKMGDMVIVDAHIEVNRHLTVEQGHDISEAARRAVMQRHRVLDLLAHVDPVDPVKSVDSRPNSPETDLIQKR